MDRWLRSKHSARLRRWGPAALLGLLWAASSAGELVAGAHGFAPFLDDAYYYIVIARQFLETGSFSFDGINPTNGFHPLWCLMLVGLHALAGVGAAPATVVFAVVALQRLCIAVALLLIVRAYPRLRATAPAFAAGLSLLAVCLLLPSVAPFRLGMECSLVALLCTGALIALAERRARALGGWLALLCLARLDTLVFVIGPIAAWASLHACTTWSQRLRLLLPTALAFAGYAAVNLYAMGHVMPISGALKSSFPWPTPRNYYLDELAWVEMEGWGHFVRTMSLTGITAAVGLGSLALLLTRRSDGGRAMAPVVVVAWLLLVNILLFQRWDKPLPRNYLALPGIFGAVLLGAGVWLSLHRRAAAAAVFKVLLAAASLRIGWSYARDYAVVSALRVEIDPLSQIAAYVKEHSEPSTVFATTDSGYLAFWSDRRWVNLDGLVNDYAYQDVLRDGRLKSYLRANGVRYLLVTLFSEVPAINSRAEKMYLPGRQPDASRGTDYAPFEYRVYSYLHERYSDPLVLGPRQEWYRYSFGKVFGVDAACVIYSLEWDD